MRARSEGGKDRRRRVAATVRVMGGRVRSGIILKSAREIGLMREAGRLVHDVLSDLEGLVRPGVTTGALNEVAERRIADAGATALFKGVVNPQARFAFPAALCTSVNDEVVHGIPGQRVLREGDIVSVDCGVRLDGYCGDSARTFAVGRLSQDARRLLDVTRATLELAIHEVRAGRMWSEIARQLQRYVEDRGMAVVRDFVGHGIGQEMHEEPKVPNYADGRQSAGDFRLEPNMTLAIEPMVNLGTGEVRFGDANRWAVVTRDGKYAAHFEHTVAVTENGADVLTAG